MNTKTQSTDGAALATAGVMVIVIGALVAILSLLWMAAWAGLALSVLWGWFVAPVFGLPALGIIQAAGIALAAGACMSPQSSPRDPKQVWMALALRPLVALVVICVGWVLKWFA